MLRLSSLPFHLPILYQALNQVLTRCFKVVFSTTQTLTATVLVLTTSWSLSTALTAQRWVAITSAMVLCLLTEMEVDFPITNQTAWMGPRNANPTQSQKLRLAEQSEDTLTNTRTLTTNNLEFFTIRFSANKTASMLLLTLQARSANVDRTLRKDSAVTFTR